MEVKIQSLAVLGQRMQYIRAMAERVLEKGVCIVTIGEESRTKAMNAKFHAMITDISKTVETNQKYSFDAWKAHMVHEFAKELASMGKQLRKPGESVVSFDGNDLITIRPSTTEFSKEEGSMFIEFLYSWGIDHGAKFSEKSLDIYAEHANGS